MQSELINFKPKAPWFGSDLQTLRNTIVRDRADLSKWPSEQFQFEMKDGSGDRLFATLNKSASVTAKPSLIILIHGMSGSENSATMLNTAEFYLQQGFSTLRINLRGAGSYRSYARGTYHSGRSEDINAIFESLPVNLADNVFIIGHSLGGNVLIKSMSEVGRVYQPSIPILGAASLCAPIDLAKSQGKFSQKRNYFYQRAILGEVKSSLRKVKSLSVPDKQVIDRVKTLHDLDDTIVAPSIGLKSAEDYYSTFSAINFLPKVQVPMLISAALDDHWVCVDSYLNFDWSQNPNLRPAITNTGGHCGSHETGFNSTWFDRHTLKFLDGLISST